MTRASAEHWEVRTGGKHREGRYVEILHDGWLIATYLFSAREDRWFQSRRPRTDDPEIPADVMADAQQEMRN